MTMIRLQSAHMIRLVAVVVTGISFLWSPIQAAATANGMMPARVTLCSGLQGGAFGLCTAYCVAQDCAVYPHPSCGELRKNFHKATGTSVFPCDATPTPTPMPT